MENTVLAVISRQMGIQREMDAIANNLANSSTDGFKSERILFSEILQDIGNNQSITFMKAAGVIRDYSDGPLRMTGNPLDIAIRGEGFFKIETDNGIFYTRSGRLNIDATGMIVNADGQPFLGDSDLPILTIPGDNSIVIEPDGRVLSDSGELGRLALVVFEDISRLEKIGSGLYASKADPIIPDDPGDVTVIQGALEGSNVVSITEMTKMISLLRSYQGSQTLGNEEHDLRRKAISVIGSVSQSA